MCTSAEDLYLKVLKLHREHRVAAFHWQPVLWSVFSKWCFTPAAFCLSCASRLLLILGCQTQQQNHNTAEVAGRSGQRLHITRKQFMQRLVVMKLDPFQALALSFHFHSVIIHASGHNPNFIVLFVRIIQRAQPHWYRHITQAGPPAARSDRF